MLGWKLPYEFFDIVWAFPIIVLSELVLYVGCWARGPCVVCSSTLTLQGRTILVQAVGRRALGPGLGCSSAFIGCSC